jgi:hypothetical protein
MEKGFEMWESDPVDDDAEPHRALAAMLDAVDKRRDRLTLMEQQQMQQQQQHLVNVARAQEVAKAREVQRQLERDRNLALDLSDPLRWSVPLLPTPKAAPPPRVYAPYESLLPAPTYNRMVAPQFVIQHGQPSLLPAPLVHAQHQPRPAPTVPLPQQQQQPVRPVPIRAPVVRQRQEQQQPVMLRPGERQIPEDERLRLLSEAAAQHMAGQQSAKARREAAAWEWRMNEEQRRRNLPHQ